MYQEEWRRVTFESSLLPICKSNRFVGLVDTQDAQYSRFTRWRSEPKVMLPLSGIVKRTKDNVVRFGALSLCILACRCSDHSGSVWSRACGRPALCRCRASAFCSGSASDTASACLC